MSLTLRAEFHRWSRWYPRRFRERNDSAMLGTYLDVADATGRQRLTASDKAAMVVGGLDARLDLIAPAAVRARVATVMIGLLGAFGLVTAVCFEWVPWARGARADYLAQVAHWLDVPVRQLTFGPFLSPFIIISLLALASFLACVVGPVPLYRSLLGATIVAAIVVGFMGHFGPATMWLRALPCVFVVIVAAMAMPATRPTPRASVVSLVLWLSGMAISLVLAAAFTFAGPQWWLPTNMLPVAEPTSEFFFRVVPIFTSSATVFIALIAALALGIAKRTALSATIILSTLPWAVAAVFGSSQGRGERIIVFGVCSLIAAAFTLGLRRSKLSGRQTEADTAGHAEPENTPS
ncbi:hypothetical protein [Humibacter ginsenosidimutans]|uniref:Uncharacterized protein n=1 Tax=Humibacter ginsenosidimutans TaxID=2599293 RepID=A0A5B8M192_9MICO|nr:hypothetical protein [Humibacter ginsenosidimutans]QDZ14447.1 hypothetical protein FPZ11_06455 [Humibacter ginsenosidimutans]